MAAGSFGRALTAADHEDLRARGRIRRFPAGSALLVQGGRSGWVALLNRGRVKVSSITEDGRELVMAILSPGELLGDLAAIDEWPQSASVVALEPVEALVVPIPEFLACLDASPRIRNELLCLLANRFRRIHGQAIEFAATDTIGRVAGRLVELAERFGEPQGAAVGISLRLTQDDLACWAWCSREAVCKALAALRSRGLIVTHRRRITVLDLEGLRDRAAS